eukprot:g9161.t1
MSLSKNIFIVGAKRTAFGTYGGTFKSKSPTDLCAHAARAALTSAQVDPALVDTVIVGNVQQTGEDTIYLARHVGLQAGVDIETPCLTVNRLCGSGFESIASVCRDMMVGDAEIGLAGGAEVMSQAPYVARSMRWGTKLGVSEPLVDSLWEGLTDKGCGLPMAITAENLAEQYNVTREECDEFGARSQRLWKEAQDAGRFTDEIAPYEVKTKKGTTEFAVDEHPRPSATAEAMANLPSIFKKNGTVTAGNASGISDGAGALVLATEDAVEKHNLKPMARIVAFQSSGVDPTIMGIGPAPAIRGVLDKAGMTLDQIDRIEINEAFAAQFIACERELGLNRDICNVNGGAIALGHPTGASGSRIIGHLAHQMQNDKDLKYTIGSACIGGGQGIAILLENCS